MERPHGHGTYTERLLYYEITINMRYQYSHQPDPTPQDAWQQGTVKQQRVRKISDNKWQVVYENTAPVYHPYEGEARKWLTDVLEDHGIETATAMVMDMVLFTRGSTLILTMIARV